MRLALVAVASAAAAAALGAAHAAEPEALSFSADAETYTVARDDLASVTLGDPGGLTLCFAPAGEAGLAAFTGSHIGDLVTVAIGETEVFQLTVTKPYAGGCIDWPLHPRIAEGYRGRLLGADPEGN